MTRWMSTAGVLAALLCSALPAAAQTRIYLARTESCTPSCTSRITALDPAALAVRDVVSVPVEIGSHPYLTPDGRLLVWFAGAYSGAPYRLVIHDVVSRELTVIPWAWPVPGNTLGNPRRPELYAAAGDALVALTAGGTRSLVSPAACLRSRNPEAVSADGRRLLATCSDSTLAFLTLVIDLDTQQVVWQADGFWLGVFSADGEFLYRQQSNLISRVSLAGGATTAQVTGPVTNAANYLHVEPGTGRLLAIGTTEARLYTPDTLQPLASWTTPWSAPGFTNVASLAIEPSSGRTFIAAGSGVGAAGAPFGEYHVLATDTGSPVVSASAGARGIPDVGWVILAPVPPAPLSLQATVAAGSATLSWSASPSTTATTRYVLEVGSAPGLNDIIAGLDVGLQTSFGASGVPPGRYYVRVRAGNYTGLSAPSNEVVVQVP